MKKEKYGVTLEMWHKAVGGLPENLALQQFRKFQKENLGLTLAEMDYQPATVRAVNNLFAGFCRLEFLTKSHGVFRLSFNPGEKRKLIRFLSW